MARIPRIEGQSLIYFTAAEGKKGKNIFGSEKERDTLKNLFREEKYRSKLSIYAYSIFNNQYLLLFETSQPNLSSSLHNINSQYANFYNRNHRNQHGIFRNRYSCFLIEKKYLFEVSTYIHTLVTTKTKNKEIHQYEWSSYPGYINKHWREDWMEYDYILERFGKITNRALNKNIGQAYKHYLQKISEEPIVNPFCEFKKTNILGSGKFKTEIMKKRGCRKSTSILREKKLAYKIIGLVNNRATWPHILKRNACIYFIKKYTFLDSHEISLIFESLQKSSIRQMSFRFRHALNENLSLKNKINKLEKQILMLVYSE